MPRNSIFNKISKGKNGTWISRSNGDADSTGEEVDEEVFIKANCKKTNVIK